MMPSPKLEGGTHRIRVRAPGAPGRDRDALHALLAIASAAQQERSKPPDQQEQAASVAASEAGAAPGPPPAYQEALQRMAESVCAVTEATGVAIAVARGPDMVCMASTGKCAIEVGALIDLRRGLAGRCVRTGEAQNCPDSENDTRVNRAACRELGVRSLVMVPVRRRRQAVVGVLSVFSDQPEHFSSRNLRFLEFMAGLVLEATERGRQEPSASPGPPAAAVPMEPLRLTVALATASHSRSAPPPASPREERPQPQATTLRSGFRIAALALLAAAAVAALLWTGWPQVRRWLHPPVGTSPPAVEARAPEPPPPAAAPQASTESQPVPAVEAAARPETSAIPPPALDGRAQLTAVQYSSVAGGTRVVLELDRAVRYRASRLDSPARLFFDLKNTHLALAEQSFPADDALLRSIRVAQYRRDVARVVLDLKLPAIYTTTLESGPPRLVIELRPPPSK